MFINYLIYGGIFIVGLIYLYFKKVFSYWKDRNVLAYEGRVPMGNMNDVGTKIHAVERLQGFYEHFKGQDVFCGFYFMTAPTLIILDLDFLRNFLVKDFNTFHDRGVYMNEENDPLSANLFCLPGDCWRAMRNKLSPTFSSGKIKNMFSTITDNSEQLRNYVKKLADNNEVVEVKNLSLRFTADVIGLCAFGVECNALKDENPKIIEIADQVFRAGRFRSLQFFFVNVFQNFSRYIGLRLFPKIVSDFIMDMVQDTVTHREKNNIQRNDFMNILIEIKNLGKISNNDDKKSESVGKITFNELAAQAFVFFFAGFETSSTTMSFCLCELALNKDIQEKTRNEINTVLKKHEGLMTYEAIMEMTYLEQVVNETLRKYPPLGILIRSTNKDYAVPNTDHIIEKGTQMFVPTYAIHRDANIYPEPDKFDPDRFTAENIKSRHPFAFLPFGEGPRMCIGMRFAMIQVKVGLASLLTHFMFSVNSKTELPIVLDPKDPNMSAKGGIWLDCKEI